MAYTLISRISEALSYRLALATGIGAGFFLIWSNLAVGLIGSENNDINALYFLLLVVGFAGALVSRFQAKGMTWVMGGCRGGTALDRRLRPGHRRAASAAQLGR
jgi:uncharacterized membrane protein